MEDIPELDISSKFSLLGLIGNDNAEFVIDLSIRVSTDASKSLPSLVKAAFLDIPCR